MIDDYLTLDHGEILIERTPAPDEWGHVEEAPARVKINGHYRSIRRLFTTEAGEQVGANGVFTFPPGTVLTFADRIIFNGQTHRPVRIERPRSLDGEASTRVWVA